MRQKIEFLQSEDWLAFQEATGKKAVRLSGEEFSGNGIIHTLPIAGQYLYVPRGPIIGIPAHSSDEKHRASIIGNGMRALLEKAEEHQAGWIRIEPRTETILKDIGKVTNKKIVKAPHDMQPREVFIVDISRSEEDLFVDMKPKTRYNIRLAQKRGVRVFATREEKYRQAFLDLIRETADRQDITPHPRAYYEKLLTVLPEEACRLFVAEYEGRVIAANLLMVYGSTATYLHGGSGDQYRDVMAPYLLQWEQMRFAKAQGCTRYDFGGVYTGDAGQEIHDNGQRKTDKERSLSAHRSAPISNRWAGITRFKRGFSPKTATVVFPGAYDIILNPRAYALYGYLRHLQLGIACMRKFVSH